MSACGPKANSIRKNAEMHPPTFAVRRFHQPEISTEANLGLDVANVRIVVSLPLKENAPNLVEAMNHVSPLLRPRLWIPSRRRTPGFHRSYAFPKPGNASKSILVMNVHPSAVVNPPGPTTAEPFAPEALYEFKIDTNGDV